MTLTLTPGGVAWVDGEWKALDEASISILDLGFTRSDVTYDVVHVWDGAFFRLGHHLDRFLRSTGILNMDIGMSREGLADLLAECVRRTGLRRAYVAMVCTRGRPPAGSRDLRLCHNKLIAYAVPFVWIGGEKAQATGLSAIIPPFRRIPPESVDPTVKNYHWLDLERGQLEAYERGADTAILLGTDGNVTEGPGFNVFAVFGDRVVTPDRGVLEGITRGTVIDLCRERGIPLEVGPLPEARFREADEIFVTSTAGGLMPIVRLDDRILFNGVPGPVTARMRDLYWQRHADAADLTPVDYGQAEAAE
ncbi:branched chain amino acid aminotransferase [Stella humosa]|uniref:Probable branched-chain-amino-acid aminotransferase n=1 Tax=Stella humosa TaxID=94 RepID=A0A3N1MET1_9PROT|nr:aminotransferase class IV [Stella humosa]ROQ01809.1 branched chain amino acid aminotransferase [Stella humosa]BBK32196.1 branched-chain amino acid transferase [Stella humosa]